MGLVSQLYDLAAKEAMELTDSEANFLLETAHINLMEMAISSPAMKEILRQRTDTSLRQVREARRARMAEGAGQEGGVGAPPK